MCFTLYHLYSNQCDQKSDAQKKTEDDPKTENEHELEQTKTEKEKDEERAICNAKCFDEKMECVLRCPFLSNEHSIHVCQFATKRIVHCSLHPLLTVFLPTELPLIASQLRRTLLIPTDTSPKTLQTLARRSPCTTLSGVWISVIRKAKDVCWSAGRAI
ncbi:hypothetical protein BLNAU_10174 [Blattamonas nauphoetae]|uniref:Uncharacterized protein n=1 Tax=Blattamonas nauphoetae TaxID=2049346 RepID=A0ABQ9XIB7_9EUKA|nr:hypothetical protein BLNAU_13274 [Blattamonas nauphoetae]KAK2954844.1 hypothetical protein BLNAU_10174 [Blattamonas nauphoetae]